MNSIINIVCYFGQLPVSFQTWLHTCRHYTTVNRLIVKDDQTPHIYLPNVSEEYT